MPSPPDASDVPYKSENDNVRPSGEGLPPKPVTTPAAASDAGGGGKTRTDPNTGAPTGVKPDHGG